MLPQDGVTGNPRWFQSLLIASAVLTFVSFWALLIVYSSNVPYWDDYISALDFIKKIKETPDFSHKIQLIFKQHNEHRIVFARLIYLLQNWFFGINFKFIILFGNISLIGILWFLYRCITPDLRNIYTSSFIILFIFNNQYWQASIWPIATLTILFVIFLAAISLYLIHKNTPVSFALSLVFSALTTFSNGNGMFVLFAGIFLIFMLKQHNVYKFIYIIFSLLVITLYFVGYKTSASHPDFVHLLLNYPIRISLSFFTFLGSNVTFFDFFFGNYFKLAYANMAFSTLVGTIYMAIILFFVQKGYYKRNPLLFSLLIFLLLTGAAAAISRGAGGLGNACISRYRIYSVLAVAVMLLLSYEVYYEKLTLKYYKAALFVFLSFNIISFIVNYTHIVKWSSELIEGALLFKTKGDASLLGYPDDKDNARRILQEAEKNHIFKLTDVK